MQRGQARVPGLRRGIRRRGRQVAQQQAHLVDDEQFLVLAGGYEVRHRNDLVHQAGAAERCPVALFLFRAGRDHDGGPGRQVVVRQQFPVRGQGGAVPGVQVERVVVEAQAAQDHCGDQRQAGGGAEDLPRVPLDQAPGARPAFLTG